MSDSAKFYTKKDAKQILGINSDMQFFRLIKKNKVNKISEGNGLPSYYLKKDIDDLVNDRTPPVEVARIEPPKQETTPPKPPNTEGQASTPTLLNRIGRAEYSRVKALLIKTTELDETWLQVYAIAYQNYFIYSYEVAKCNGVEVDAAGHKKPSIYIRMAAEAFKQMDRAAAVLGIGALNEQKISAKSESDAIDEMQAILNGN